MGMSKIAILADKEAATYFKLTGVKNSRVAGTKEEAERCIRTILKDSSISLIIVTDQIFNWLRPMLPRMATAEEFPIIVAVPGMKGKKPKTDLLADLIETTVEI